MLNDYRHSDIEKATEIFNEIFTSPPFSFDFMNVKKAGAYLSDIAKTPGFIGFRYEHNGEDIGFCFGLLNNYFAIPYYEIREIFISIRLQREGLGSRMLSEVESALALSGINTVVLNTLRSIPAFSYYTKNGYLVSEDSVHMCKFL